MGENITFWESLVIGHPICVRWKPEAEGSIFHLASVMFILGYMGGSGYSGLLYVFIFLSLGFLCSLFWAWLDACAADVFSWNFALFVICIIQIIHVAYQLRSVTFDKEFQEVYSSLFQPLGISLTVFGKIMSYCNAEVVTLEKDHCYAMQGKTPIDKLSLLVSGRIYFFPSPFFIKPMISIIPLLMIHTVIDIHQGLLVASSWQIHIDQKFERMRVTVDGEFLHYIFPLQFLDSPEWDSLRPSEEGIFQVTLIAETDCRYVAWRRKKLYLLFAKHRYISRLFSILIRSDIADKLYALNDKVHVGRGLRFDIRLPNFYHVAVPESSDPHLTEPFHNSSFRHSTTSQL